jgi:hypothetical protein
MAGVWGSPTAKGVTDAVSASGPNSAYMATDLDGDAGSFQLVMKSADFAADNLVGGSLSVNLAANVDLTGAASVGFHLWDSTGTEWETTAADRVGVTTSFQNFTQTMDYLTTWGNYSVIAWGSDSAVSPDSITAIGLNVYDEDGAVLNGATFYVDDLQAIPEPASMLMMAVGAGCMIFVRRRLKM